MTYQNCNGCYDVTICKQSSLCLLKEVESCSRSLHKTLEDTFLEYKNNLDLTGSNGLVSDQITNILNAKFLEYHDSLQKEGASTKFGQSIGNRIKKMINEYIESIKSIDNIIKDLKIDLNDMGYYADIRGIYGAYGEGETPKKALEELIKEYKKSKSQE